MWLKCFVKVQGWAQLIIVCIVKAMIFPLVMYGCESWTIKKNEHRRADAFKWWSWRRFLRVPWQQEDQTSLGKGGGLPSWGGSEGSQCRGKGRWRETEASFYSQSRRAGDVWSGETPLRRLHLSVYKEWWRSYTCTPAKVRQYHA